MSSTIKQELVSRGYVTGYEQDQRREAALTIALTRQCHAFTHFVTVTFPRSTNEQEALEAIHQALRALDGLNQKRVRFFYELSLSPRHLYGSTTEDSTGEQELLTHWHVHLLLGGLRDSVTPRQLSRVFRQQCHGFVCVMRNDGSPRLSEYLASRSRGNRIGGLQQTNDRTIRSTLASFGEAI